MKTFYILSQILFLTIALILTVFNIKHRFYSNKTSAKYNETQIKDVPIPTYLTLIAKEAIHNNKKVIQAYLEERYPGIKENVRCSCQNRLRPECPMPGMCEMNNVVYKCTVTRLDNGHVETYTGGCKNLSEV